MKATIKDMTRGNPAKLIFLFAIPLILGNLFQQFYMLVDTIVVGQGVGVDALAAIGAADCDQLDGARAGYRPHPGLFHIVFPVIWC